MRAFAVAWPDEYFVQGVLAQLPWYSNLALLEKLGTFEERRWYAHKAIEHGWSRNVLVLQIEARAIKRTGAALTNFKARLPKPHSDLARESLKDPYRLDFLGLGDDAQERVGKLRSSGTLRSSFSNSAPAAATDEEEHHFHRHHRRPGSHRWRGGRTGAEPRGAHAPRPLALAHASPG